MNATQCRAARALLKWTQLELAGAAGITFSTVVDFEGEKRRRSQYEKVMAMRHALEQAGVVFIPAKNGRGFGVRLKDDPSKPPHRTRP